MFDFRYPTPLPSTKGWGPGWPNCQFDRRVPHPIFQGGVHERIKELVDILVAHLEEKGYIFKPGWSWGWGCRATDKDAEPGDDATPSFHSWGLGLDFNAPENPFSRSAGDTAKLNNEHKWVVPIMREYGFFWLGPEIGDWMHFSFCGSPADADRMTQKARENLMRDERFDKFIAGWKKHRNNQPKPDGGWEETGWFFRQEATSNPKPAAHGHEVSGRAE